MTEIIVALDVDDVQGAKDIVKTIGDEISFYKVGMELAYSPGGMEFARELKSIGKRVFLDLKIHDIETTVERTVARLSEYGFDFLSVHAYHQTMGAAVKGRTNGLKLLGVTVLTSYTDMGLYGAGYGENVAQTVASRVWQAAMIKMDGVVCSPQEVAEARSIGPALTLVTPGIRLPTDFKNDQTRAGTPEAAIAAGSDYLVVGRPITRSGDMKEAAKVFKAYC